MTSISQIQIGLRPHTQPNRLSGPASLLETDSSQHSPITPIQADTLATALRATTLRFGSNGLDPEAIIAAIPKATDWQMTSVLTSPSKRTATNEDMPAGTVISFMVAPFVYGLYNVPGQTQAMLTGTRVDVQGTPQGQSQVIALDTTQQIALNTAINIHGRPSLAAQISRDAEARLADGNGSWRITQAPDQEGHESLSFSTANNRFQLVRQTQPIDSLNTISPFSPTPYELRHTLTTTGEVQSVPLTAEEYTQLNRQWRKHAMPVITKAHRLDADLNVNGHLTELTRLVWNDSPYVHVEQVDDRPHEIRIGILPVREKTPLMNPAIVPQVTSHPTSPAAGRMFILNTEHPVTTITMYNPPYAKLQRRLDQPESAALGQLLTDVARFKLAKRDHGLQHLVVSCLVEPKDATKPDVLNATFRQAFPGANPHPNPVEHTTQEQLLAERVAGLIPGI